MWAFLGIFSFTYVYKKFDAILSLTHKDIVFGLGVFFATVLALLLVAYRYGQIQKIPLLFRTVVDIVSSLPLAHIVFSKSPIPEECCQREDSCVKVGYTGIFLHRSLSSCPVTACSRVMFMKRH